MSRLESFLLPCLLLGCSDAPPGDETILAAARSSEERDDVIVGQTPSRDAGATPPDEAHTPKDAGTQPPAAPLSLRDGRPMLIEFTRDHCMPCALMAPWVKELQEKLGSDIDIVEINIDRPGNDAIGIHFKIASIPTQVYLDRTGKEVARNVGLATGPQMERTLRRKGLLAADTPTKTTPLSPAGIVPRRDRK